MSLLSWPSVDSIFGIVLAILLTTIGLVAFAIAHRRAREIHFRAVDKLRAECGPILKSLLDGTCDYEIALASLKHICPPGQLPILGEFLAATDPSRGEAPVLGRLCEDLGLVTIWQQRLAGAFEETSIGGQLVRRSRLFERVSPLSFVLRAESAQSLGAIRHQPSWRILVRALDDPSRDVRSVVARALAAIGEPESLPALVKCVEAAVLAAPAAATLSLRHIKAALATFPLESVGALRDVLVHPHPRVRYLATDIVRLMVEREAAAKDDAVLKREVFPLELADLFITELAVDANPDVRARAAQVIARLDDRRSLPLLRGLLDDGQWFVRLCTTRALASPKYRGLAQPIAERLTDPNWRVREAATRTLLGFGTLGMDYLLDHFLNSHDLYSREQIAEELGRAGTIEAMARRSGRAGYQPETRVIEHLQEVGKVGIVTRPLLQGI